MLCLRQEAVFQTWARDSSLQRRSQEHTRSDTSGRMKNEKAIFLVETQETYIGMNQYMVQALLSIVCFSKPSATIPWHKACVRHCREKVTHGPFPQCCGRFLESPPSH